MIKLFAPAGLSALALGAALLVAPAVTSPAHAEDACAGQTWPNLSEACIDQQVKKLCEAGGGGSTCGSSSSSSARPAGGYALQAPARIR